MNSKTNKKKKFFKKYFKKSDYCHDFLQTREWLEIKTRALKKYGKTCMRCSSKKSINVDHVLSRKNNPELALTIENLQILCAPCNKDKGLKTTDYRANSIAPITLKSKAVDFILRKTSR